MKEVEVELKRLEGEEHALVVKFFSEKEGKYKYVSGVFNKNLEQEDLNKVTKSINELIKKSQ